MSERYFSYGEKEVSCLKAKDKRLGELMDEIGPVRRAVDSDLFSSVVHQIIGQQISMKAQETIWNRLQKALGAVTPETILKTPPEELRTFGISPKKAESITEFAQKTEEGTFDLKGLYGLSDEEAVRELSSLRGVGVWTAEMILLFGMERPDVLSYEDFGIKKGLCMLYHHPSLSRQMFSEYRRRYHPYGSVASLYLWALAGGAGSDITSERKNGK